MKHAWDVTPAEAIAIQKRLAESTVLTDDFGDIETVAGVDVGIDKTSNTARAAVVVLRLEDLVEVEAASAELALRFPYVPGLLSFREIPAIALALARLSHQPDLLLCDGQGIAHPRRLGLASHLGLFADIPAVGVAKTRLIGTHGEVPETKGGWTELVDGGEVIGAVLRTRSHVKPLYISAGHRISLISSISFVMQCITAYRLPETTRRAHRLSQFSNR